METDIKELLKQVLANQVIIYKRIENLEYKIKNNGFRSASDKTYVEELKKKTLEILPFIL